MQISTLDRLGLHVPSNHVAVFGGDNHHKVADRHAQNRALAMREMQQKKMTMGIKIMADTHALSSWIASELIQKRKDTHLITRRFPLLLEEAEYGRFDFGASRRRIDGLSATHIQN